MRPAARRLAGNDGDLSTRALSGTSARQTPHGPLRNPIRRLADVIRVRPPRRSGPSTGVGGGGDRTWPDPLRVIAVLPSQPVRYVFLKNLGTLML